MQSVQALQHKDLIQKSLLAILAFSFSLISGGLLAFLDGLTTKALFYGSEVLFLWVSFLLLRYVFKKALIFSYVIVSSGYIFAIIAIYLFGSSLSIALIFFFLLFLSTLYLRKSIFIIGGVLGLIGLYINTTAAPAELVILEEIKRLWIKREVNC